MCIQGNPKLREGHGQLETEIDVRRLGAAESNTSTVTTEAEHVEDVEVTHDTPYLTIKREIWAVYCENIGDKRRQNISSY